MKTWQIVLLVIAAVLIVSVSWLVLTYNSLVGMNEEVNGKWAQVETQLQRRYDLIPNLVSTVQGYADYEKETLTKITELRSQWQTAKSVNEKVQTANQLESTISKLLVISENYPDLKANQNFLAFQDELANTENKLSVERGRYNDAVKAFNARIKFFPTNIIAGMFGFAQRDYFESTEGAEKAPVVSFK